VAERLRGSGYRVHDGVGDTGVVGVLANGDGPTVLLRADMDALPVREATGLPYASTDTATDADGNQVPVMHACGHDMHVASLLGAAHMLAERVDQWSGTVVALFQPAEEVGDGARDGGGRAGRDRPGGRRRPGAAHSAAAGGRDRHPGRPGALGGRQHADHAVWACGGHGSMPQVAVDPVVLAAMIVFGCRPSWRARPRRVSSPC
jgi:hippurate hydrolase